MALAASFHTSYDLANFQGILAPVLEKAAEAVTDGLRSDFARFLEYSGDRVLMERFQLPLARGCQGAVYTIGELNDSYTHEVTAQVILPDSVEKILLGNDGLIKKSGGGRARYLLQDIQVGYIKDPQDSEAETIGPIVISGRNRLVALQAFLSVVCPRLDVRNVQLRCMAYSFTTRVALEDAIVAANSGRDFPRSEKREKKATAGGLDLSSKSSIRNSLPGYSKQPPANAIVGAWIKMTASEQQLNTLTGPQLSDAGASLINRLAKDVKPSGMTLGAWFKQDGRRLIALCEALEPKLADGIKNAAADPAVGKLSTKLAMRLLPTALDALKG
jgi:hypothetical protein